MNDRLLGRDQLEAALDHLADRLHRRGVHAEIYVFGGGAMVLAYNAREATMDLDAVIKRAHGAVVAEAREVAAELGLPGWWLNEQGTVYLPAADDRDARKVLDRPGLTVMAASPRHLLAMKVHAARSRDVADIVTLARVVGVSDAEQVGRLAEEVFGGEPLSERSRVVLAALADEFGAGGGTTDLPAPS